MQIFFPFDVTSLVIEQSSQRFPFWIYKLISSGYPVSTTTRFSNNEKFEIFYGFSSIDWKFDSLEILLNKVLEIGKTKKKLIIINIKLAACALSSMLNFSSIDNYAVTFSKSFKFCV